MKTIMNIERYLPKYVQCNLSKTSNIIIKMWYGNSRSHMKSKHTFKAIFDKWITNTEDLTNSKTDYKTVVMKIPWDSARTDMGFNMEQETESRNRPRHILGFPIW